VKLEDDREQVQIRRDDEESGQGIRQNQGHASVAEWERKRKEHEKVLVNADSMNQ
jgi:hypothetical protein